MRRLIIHVTPDLDRTYAEELRQHYGKHSVLHDWQPGTFAPRDALILTHHKVDGAITLDQAIDAMWWARIQSKLARIKQLGSAQGQKDAVTVFVETLFERERQDEQHGGAIHDDAHAPMDWINLVEHQIDKLGSEGGEHAAIPDTALIRARLVKIGALAIAGISSIDRLTSAEQAA